MVSTSQPKPACHLHDQDLTTPTAGIKWDSIPNGSWVKIHHDLHGDVGLHAFDTTNMIKQSTFTIVWNHMQLAAEWFTRQVSLFKYRWNMTNQGCQQPLGFPPISRSGALHQSGPYAFPVKTQNTVEMTSVLPNALLSHLSTRRDKSLSDSTFLSWGSRMTAGLCLSLGTLPAFAWILGLFLNGRAFCKAFGMCSELKCFFCLRIGWKGKNKTETIFKV